MSQDRHNVLRAFREYASAAPSAKAQPSTETLILPRPEPGTYDTILSLIRRLRPRRRLFALVETLKACSPAEADELAPELLELLAKHRRSDVSSATALVFACLPAQAKSAAVCVAGPDLVTAAAGLDLTDPLARRSLAALAAGTSDPALASRLTTLLADADPDVVGDAERAVVDTAEALATSADLANDAAFASLLQAVDSYDRHRRKGVLHAALRLLGTPAGLARAASDAAGAKVEWLHDASHPAQMAIRSLLRRGDSPEIAAAAMVWLRLPTQSQACRERLLAAGSLPEHEAVLRWCHLLAHPVRQRVMRAAPAGRLADAPWSVHLPAYAELGVEARRQTPRWVASLPLAPDEAATMLAPLAADPSPLVRAALVVHSPAAGLDELSDLAFDEDPGVARMAVVRLAQRCAQRPLWRRGSAQQPTEAERAVTRLKRSPHACVRAIADAALPDEHGPAARIAWRAAFKRDRAGALADLRDRVLMGTTADRVRWIGTARRLQAADALERELCDIVEDGDAPRAGTRSDAVLVASAVAALGECSGARARAVLEAALNSPESRVVSNAIEALARRSARRPVEGPPSERILEFKETAEHRPRATAALAAARLFPGGALAARDTLRAMLADPRPAHRVAGVWLAERSVSIPGFDSGETLCSVRGLQDDPDSRVRARATRCAARLALHAPQEAA